MLQLRQHKEGFLRHFDLYNRIWRRFNNALPNGIVSIENRLDNKSVLSQLLSPGKPIIRVLQSLGSSLA